MTRDAHPDVGPVLARLRRPRADRTRLAVVADPHVGTRSSGTSKLYDHSLDHFITALEDAGSRDVDAIVSPGDLTKDGEPWNYEAVEAALNDVSVPFYSVPGNHDVAKAGDDHDPLPVDEYADRFATGSYPFKAEVGSVELFGLNSAGTADRLADTHDGRVDAAQLDWLETELRDSAAPVVLVHHNFPPVTDQLRAHRSVRPDMAIPPAMRDPEPFGEVLADADVPLVLTGHHHVPLTGVYKGVREVAAPPTCSFPQAYLLCDVTPDGTTVRLVPVADEPMLETAHTQRSNDSRPAAGLTAVSAARLASLPLVYEE